MSRSLQEDVDWLKIAYGEQLEINRMMMDWNVRLGIEIEKQINQIQLLRNSVDELSKRQGLMGPVSPFPLETPASTYFFATS